MNKILSLLFGKKAGKQAKTNASDNSNSSDETLINTIEGTPFATVKKGEHDYVIVFGKYMITNRHFISKRQAEDWTAKTEWFAILNAVTILIQESKEVSNANS